MMTSCSVLRCSLMDSLGTAVKIMTIPQKPRLVLNHYGYIRMVGHVADMKIWPCAVIFRPKITQCVTAMLEYLN